MSYSKSKAKCGCEGCIYEQEISCPAEDDNGNLLPQDERICYNKEENTELILIDKEV